jgi:hypothetical protein
VTGLIHEREVDVLVATHGWWPWLLTLAILIVAAFVVINYFLKRRRSVSVLAPRHELRQAILLARESGETLQNIGAAAGLTAERVRQIVKEKD